MRRVYQPERGRAISWSRSPPSDAKKLRGNKELDAMMREDREPGTMGRGGWR
jgi:hypothetical protein